MTTMSSHLLLALLVAAAAISTMWAAVGVAQPAVATPQQLPGAVIATLIALLRSTGLNTAALIVTYMRDLLKPKTTLLIPSDQAIAAVAPMLLNPSTSSEQALRNIVSAHILASNFSFSDLQLLPAGTLIPTLLNQVRLQVNNNSADNYTLNNAQLQGNNICGQIPDVACYTINQVLSVPGVTPEGLTNATSNATSPPPPSTPPPPGNQSSTTQPSQDSRSQTSLQIHADQNDASSSPSPLLPPCFPCVLFAAVLVSCTASALLFSS